MGSYTTRIVSNSEIKDIITNIRDGYEDWEGVPHKPNPQVATILLLQANLGCRINDIVHMTVENIEYDGEAWRLNLIEQKTGKARPFIVPTPVKAIIDNYCEMNDITSGRLFNISAQAVWKAMRQVTAFLGLNNVGTHSFRKASGLRVYLNSGKDIALTTQYYQHNSTATTMKYLKRSSKQMDDIISKSTCLV